MQIAHGISGVLVILFPDGVIGNTTDFGSVILRSSRSRGNAYRVKTYGDSQKARKEHLTPKLTPGTIPQGNVPSIRKESR